MRADLFANSDARKAFGNMGERKPFGYKDARNPLREVLRATISNIVIHVNL